MLKTFAFLATLYTSDGPVLFTLDTGLSGSDCIAAMERGITPEMARAVTSGTLTPEGEGHVPPRSPESMAGAVLSCEFDSLLLEDW